MHRSHGLVQSTDARRLDGSFGCVMNRRSFLAAAASSLAVDFVPMAREGNSFCGWPAAKSDSRWWRAGLCCAHELRKCDYEIVVLEDQGRAGGRVQTLREGLDPELAAEAGATRIPDTHELTLSYVREFGWT
jgi:monoamine oxidase